jgi:hypothetical protein
VRKYFERTPPPAHKRNAVLVLSLACIGVMSAAGMLVTHHSSLALGTALLTLVPLAQGVRLMATYRHQYAAAEPKPTDALMDELLSADLRRAADRALQRLGITLDELELRSRDVDPLARGGSRRLADQGRGAIAVFGPTPHAVGRIGLDRKWRFATYRIMVICPTGHHLGIYQCDLDLATGRRYRERTDEYHYDDVVAIRTTTTAAPDLTIGVLDASALHRMWLRGTLYRQLQIIVSSGDRSSIIVGITDEDERGNNIPLQESGIDAVIEAVRRTLRTKKGGIVPST